MAERGMSEVLGQEAMWIPAFPSLYGSPLHRDSENEWELTNGKMTSDNFS